MRSNARSELDRFLGLNIHHPQFVAVPTVRREQHGLAIGQHFGVYVTHVASVPIGHGDDLYLAAVSPYAGSTVRIVSRVIQIPILGPVQPDNVPDRVRNALRSVTLKTRYNVPSEAKAKKRESGENAGVSASEVIFRAGSVSSKTEDRPAPSRRATNPTMTNAATGVFFGDGGVVCVPDGDTDESRASDPDVVFNAARSATMSAAD